MLCMTEITYKDNKILERGSKNTYLAPAILPVTFNKCCFRSSFKIYDMFIEAINNVMSCQ